MELNEQTKNALLKLSVGRKAYVRLSSQGRAYEAVTDALNAMGYLEDTTPTAHELKEAVRSYQRAHHIRATGLVGPLTLAQLKQDARHPEHIIEQAKSVHAESPAKIEAPVAEAEAITSTEADFRNKLIATAQAKIGGKNKGYAPKGWEWCAGFAQDSLKKTCEKFGIPSKFFEQATTKAMDDNLSAFKYMENSKKCGAFDLNKVDRKGHCKHEAKPGDLILLFQEDAKGEPIWEKGHVTIVKRVRHDKKGEPIYDCIGGNVGDKVAYQVYKGNDPKLYGFVDSGELYKHAATLYHKKHHRTTQHEAEQPSPDLAPAAPHPAVDDIRQTLASLGVVMGERYAALPQRTGGKLQIT